MIEWLAPWQDVSRQSGGDADFCQGWESQLRREVGPRHVLFGQSVELIGRRFDCDEALFLMSDGRVAEVHLTWRKNMEPDPKWPGTVILQSLEDWALDRMKPQHLQWTR